MTHSTKPNARLVWRGRKKMKTVKAWAVIDSDGDIRSAPSSWGLPPHLHMSREGARMERSRIEFWRLHGFRIARVEIREIKP